MFDRVLEKGKTKAKGHVITLGNIPDTLAEI